MLMHILEFFEGDLRTEPAWKVKFAHLVPLHTVSTYSRALNLFDKTILMYSSETTGYLFQLS